MSETRTFKLTVHYEGDHIWAEVDELPGCFAAGQDITELEEALAEAIGMYLSGSAVTSVEIEPAKAVRNARARAELVPC